jgi:cobalt-zinc-cadmium efflux system outer membrane protein
MSLIPPFHPFPESSGGTYACEGLDAGSSTVTGQCAGRTRGSRCPGAVEEKRWIPMWASALAHAKFGWTDERACNTGVTINIPLFDRNQNGVAAARERVNAPQRASMPLVWKRKQRTAPLRRRWLRLTSACWRRSRRGGSCRCVPPRPYRLRRRQNPAGRTAGDPPRTVRRANPDH